MWQPGSLSGTFAVAENIAAKDFNNLYLTSCYFTDPARYQAFCALYAVMRVVDDRIDAIPSRRALSSADKRHEHKVTDAWEKALSRVVSGESLEAHHIESCEFPQARELLQAAAQGMASFPVPWMLWDHFFDAMHQDIERPRFDTFDEFLQYTEGASVAPTTIYLYLIVSGNSDSNTVYLPPKNFDMIRCGRHLGTFAYLGHILRDLAADLATGDEGLVYLGRDDMTRFGVTEDLMRRDLARKHASEPLKQLVAELVGRAQKELVAGRSALAPLHGQLSLDCAFILELIVTLYEHVIDKIVQTSYDPMTGEHHLTADEKAAIAQQTAERVGFKSLL